MDVPSACVLLGPSRIEAEQRLVEAVFTYFTSNQALLGLLGFAAELCTDTVCSALIPNSYATLCYAILYSIARRCFTCGISIWIDARTGIDLCQPADRTQQT